MHFSALALRQQNVFLLSSLIRFLRSSQQTSSSSSPSLLSTLLTSRQPRHACRFMTTVGGNNNNNNNSNATADKKGAGDGMTVRRSALPPSDFPEHSFLKCIEKEIQDEALRLDKEEGPPPPPPGWEMYHAPGTSIFYGRRLWMPPANVKRPEQQLSPLPPRVMERHTIRAQLTTRDPSLDPECDVRGEHFPFSFFVQRVVDGSKSATTTNTVNSSADGTDKDTFFPLSSKKSDNDSAAAGAGDCDSKSIEEEEEEEERGLYEQSIEVRADFVDGELVIDNVVFHGSFRLPHLSTKPAQEGAKLTGTNKMTPANSDGCSDTPQAANDGKEQEVHFNNIFGGYPGPNLDEVEDEVLDGVQSWLAERCIDDQFGEFIGQYSVWVEQMEYERWLRQLRDFVAA